MELRIFCTIFSLYILSYVAAVPTNAVVRPNTFVKGIRSPDSNEKCHPNLFNFVQCKEGPDSTKVSGISQELFKQMKLFAQYSAAAYCRDNSNSPETPIKCAGKNCPLVEAANAISTAEFSNLLEYDNHVFVAVDDVHKVVTLVFRGAQSAINWLQIINVDPVPTDLCDDCAVHDGFWEMWTAVKSELFGAVDQALATHPDYRFAITGHSLGGALATLAAADFRKREQRYSDLTELFTYGSPRVGNGAVADLLTKQSTKNYRVTNGDDTIPRLPPSTFGYVHISPEYWISRNGNNPKPEDIDVLTGQFNDDGNAGSDIWDMNLSDHDQYFMDLADGCGEP